jgi:hypothetical protein
MASPSEDICSSLESHFGFRTLRDALLIVVILVQQCDLRTGRSEQRVPQEPRS